MCCNYVIIAVGIETSQVVCNNVTNEGVITVTAIYRSLPGVLIMNVYLSPVSPEDVTSLLNMSVYLPP